MQVLTLFGIKYSWVMILERWLITGSLTVTVTRRDRAVFMLSKTIHFQYEIQSQHGESHGIRSLASGFLHKNLFRVPIVYATFSCQVEHGTHCNNTGSNDERLYC